jgi:GNAT superfamily N-acetyltransferase
MTLTLREAAPADLPVLADIWLDSAYGEAGPPYPADAFYLAQELATGVSAVAEEDGRPVGFAVVLTRGTISNLGELFVRRSAQSNGVGAALLGRLLPAARANFFTIASHDPRALALYARHGMVPRWPYYYLRAERERLRLPNVDVEITEASWDDPAWAAWDRLIAGRPRAEEHPYLRQTCGGVPLWFHQGGATVGYGCVQLGRGGHPPDGLTIGPVGVADPSAAAACAVAAVRWAAQHRNIAQLALPGAHAALVPLLEAGFRIVDMDTFMSTTAPDFVDPRRYIPMGAEFF